MKARIPQFALHAGAILLMAVLAVSCGEPAADTATVKPEFVVDSEDSLVFLEPAELPNYEGARSRILLIPLDLEGRLIDEELPMDVVPSSGSMAGPPLFNGGIYLFEYLPDPEVGPIEFFVTANGTPLAVRPKLNLIPPCSNENPAEREIDFLLAETYAPVLYQDTGRNARADYITALDFDEDWTLDNNWENLNRYPLFATVYYSVIETQTHYFIHYVLYHPRRNGTFVDNQYESLENDLSGLMVVVEKDGTLTGRFLLMETVAGGQFYGYCDSELVHRGTEPIMGTPILEDQTHPRVFVESKSHGVVVNSPVVFGEYLGEDEADFRGGDGIVYRYKAIAEEPLDGNDRDVGYALEPILETLWPRRSEARNGDTFASVFHFTPECPLPDRMAGDNYREPGGETPWAWDDLDDEGVRRGEWFLTPARAVSSHFAIREPFSLEYTYNPFLGIPR